MKPKSTIICAFAGAVLASTVATANSAPLHSRRVSHYSHARVAVHTHHRAFQRTQLAAVVRQPRVERSENPIAKAAAAIAGGLMSGIASVYSGGRTANGEVARAGGMTAAHRSLPFGTMVKVTNQGTGRSVVVRINDRGPFVRGRVIDLTPAAARAIGFSGLAHVTLAVVRS